MFIACALGVSASSTWADVKVPVNTGEQELDPNRAQRRAVEQIMQTEESRLPIPVPLQVTVTRGEPVTIELTTQDDPATQLVYYHLKGLPEAGEVTAPMRLPDTGGNTMSVIYTAFLDSTAERDQILFSAQYPGGRVSAPGVLEILIEDPAPVLVVPSTVVFPPTRVGGFSQQTLSVSNVGNATYHRAPDLPEPWEWVPTTEEEEKFYLPPGETAELTVGFRPVEPGTMVHRFNPSGISEAEQNIEVRLIGESFPPFDLKLDQLLMRYDQETHRRVATLDVRALGQEVTLTLETDQRIRLPEGMEEVAMPAGSEAQIPIHLTERDPWPYEGRMVVEAPGWKREVLITAEAAPPWIEVASMDGKNRELDFGVVPVGQSVGRLFQLSNLGGESVVVDAEVPAPFTFPGGAEDFLKINPISRQAIRVDFAPEEEGIFQKEMELEAAGRKVILVLNGRTPGAPEIAVDGTVFGASDEDEPDLGKLNFAMTPSVTRPMNSPDSDTRVGTSLRPPSPGSSARSASSAKRPQARDNRSYAEMIREGWRGKPAPEGGSISEELKSIREEVPTRVKMENGRIALPPLISKDGKLAHSPFRKSVDLKLPVIRKLGATNQKAHSVDLVWKKQGDFKQFEVEIRVPFFNEEKQRYDTVWIPWEKVKVKTAGDVVTATMRGLKEDAYYMVRVFTIGPDGSSSLPSAEGGISTVRGEIDAGWMTILILVVLALCAGGGGYLYYRNGH